MPKRKYLTMELNFEVKRIRHSVTQGEAAVYLNSEKIIQYGDTIRPFRRKQYGPVLDGWASCLPDERFIESAKLDFANKIRRMQVRHNYVSDWGKVKQFIEDHGYIPERCALDDYITCILLHLDGFSEDEGREITVSEFLERFDEYGTFSDYDY